MQETQQQADKVVAAFRAQLSAEAQAQVGEEGFQQLAQLVDAAIQAELKEAVGLIEGVLKTLRESLEYRELEM